MRKRKCGYTKFLYLGMKYNRHERRPVEIALESWRLNIIISKPLWALAVTSRAIFFSVLFFRSYREKDLADKRRNQCWNIDFSSEFPLYGSEEASSKRQKPGLTGFPLSRECLKCFLKRLLQCFKLWESKHKISTRQWLVTCRTIKTILLRHTLRII